MHIDFEWLQVILYDIWVVVYNIFGWYLSTGDAC